jgi:hypothetical protein
VRWGGVVVGAVVATGFGVGRCGAYECEGWRRCQRCRRPNTHVSSVWGAAAAEVGRYRMCGFV